MSTNSNPVNRRAFLKASAAAVAAGTLAPAAADAAQAVAPAAAPATRPAFALASAPVLLNPSPDGVTVICLVNAPATGWVEYGPTEALGSRAVGEDAGLLPYVERALSIRLTGLKPGQTCFYRVHAVAFDFTRRFDQRRGAEVRSEIRSFRTLDPAAPSATFTVWNDTHETTETLAALAAHLRSAPTDFLFWNGDLANSVRTEEVVLQQYLNPAGQAYADATPLFFGRGNHDVRGAFARQLPRYIAGPAGGYFYQFRHGPVAALVMDTGEDKTDDHIEYSGIVDFDTYRTAQQAWLAGAIEDPQFKSAPFRVAFLHIPLHVPPIHPLTNKPYGGRGCTDGLAKWHDLLVRGKVDLIISGHTHRYAWFPAEPGRPYGQLIGGGPQPARATSITCRADASKMEFAMTDLQGKVLASHAFVPTPSRTTT